MPGSAFKMATADKPNKGLKVPFGPKVDLLLAPTDALAAGLDSECYCPGCGARPILKQGSRRRHFAHHNATCSDQCVESAIHAAGKPVLVERGALMVPEDSFHISAATRGYGMLRSDISYGCRVSRKFRRFTANWTFHNTH